MFPLARIALRGVGPQCRPCSGTENQLPPIQLGRVYASGEKGMKKIQEPPPLPLHSSVDSHAITMRSLVFLFNYVGLLCDAMVFFPL